MTQTYNEQVKIDGAVDETQLIIEGSVSQSQPLQQWQDSNGTSLAQVTDDGRLRVGDDLSLGAPSALIEANRSVDPATDTIQQGFQSVGEFDGQVSESTNWTSSELKLKGTGGVTGAHTAVRSVAINENTGDVDNAQLRGGDFQAQNESGTAVKPLNEAVGLHAEVNNDVNAYVDSASAIQATLNNASGASMNEAVGVDVESITNNGSITDAYGVRIADVDSGATSNRAIQTGKGIVELGDAIDMAAQATKPAAPSEGFLRFYPKDDGNLYVQDTNGSENQLARATDLTGLTAHVIDTNNPHSVTAEQVNALAKDNTLTFIPTADYHPATKKYVDDNAGGSGTNDFTTLVCDDNGDLVFDDSGTVIFDMA